MNDWPKYEKRGGTVYRIWEDGTEGELDPSSLTLFYALTQAEERGRVLAEASRAYVRASSAYARSALRGGMSLAGLNATAGLVVETAGFREELRTAAGALDAALKSLDSSTGSR